METVSALLQPAKSPGRGGLIFVIGLISLLFGPVAGIPAWVMGSRDLKKIRQGLIDPAEESLTRRGMILGIIGTFLATIVSVLIVLLLGRMASAFGAPAG